MKQSNPQRPTVLIIDDSELDAEVLSNLVEKADGMAFKTDQLEVIEVMADTLIFDLITVDLNLAANLNGPDLIEKAGLKDHKRKGQMPRLVIVTGECLDENEKSQYTDNGYFAVIQKPVQAEQFLELLAGDMHSTNIMQC